MKKILAVALVCLMMATVFCGCGGSSGESTPTTPSTTAPVQSGLTDGTNANAYDTVLTAQNIVGKWSLVINDYGSLVTLAGNVNEEALQSVVKMTSAGWVCPVVRINVEFTADGNMAIDTNSLSGALKDVMNSMVTWYRQGDNIYVYMEAMGMTREQVDAELKSQGMTTGQFIDTIQQGVDENIDTMLSQLPSDSVSSGFSVMDNKLYTSTDGSYQTFTYSNGKIMITGGVRADGSTYTVRNGAMYFEKR